MKYLSSATYSTTHINKYYYIHFTDEKSKAQAASDMARVWVQATLNHHTINDGSS